MNEDRIQDFLFELDENLDRLNRELVTLEQDSLSAVALDSVFRTVHTIKGTCGFLGLTRLEALVHVGEDLLVQMREGELSPTVEITTALLAVSDALRKAFASVGATGSEGLGDHSSVVATLERLSLAGQPAKGPLPEIRLGGDPRDPRRPALPDGSLRTDVGLQELASLISELMLVRDRIAQLASAGIDGALLGAARRLNQITSLLEQGIRKTRMQPIDTLFSQFPRFVRDLALQCGKLVRLEMEGTDTAFDKTLIEAVKDPLTHIVRNSVDHGIEAPQVRVQRGKPPEGVIRLRAFHESGQTIIEVSDDGAGMDAVGIRAKAQQLGLIMAEPAVVMTDHDVLRLAFLPGVSTAERVSTISGRGVGMDVVLTNIENIGGEVGIHSPVGVGTTVTIRLPAATFLMPGRMVSRTQDGRKPHPAH